MMLFITDLDGTLLGGDYRCEAALPAIAELKRLRIPLVLCTSKTRAEVEAIRRRLDNRDPFIVENGGALYIPDGCLPLDLNTPVCRAGCAVIEFGSPYPELVLCLREASEESQCTVRGFHQMSADEISRCCRMPLECARLAKQREYDEPFKILGGDPQRLTAAIEKRRKRCMHGGVFYHILGANDKAHGVNLLIHYYRTAFESVITVGLGDGMNDAEFLKLVDYPLVLESPASDRLMADVRRAQLWPGSSGPRAWNEAVLGAVSRHLTPGGEAPRGHG